MFSQWAKEQYEISFDAPSPADNVNYWEIFIEKVEDGNTFILQEDIDYSPALKYFSYSIICNLGQTGRITYLVVLPLNSKLVKVGVIAYNDEYSELGTSIPIKLTQQ
jgi:hypothetical protein